MVSSQECRSSPHVPSLKNARTLDPVCLFLIVCGVLFINIIYTFSHSHTSLTFLLFPLRPSHLPPTDIYTCLHLHALRIVGRGFQKRAAVTDVSRRPMKHRVLVCLNDDHDATTDLAVCTSQQRSVTCVCSRVYCVVTCDGFQSRVWLFALCPESQNARTLDPVCLFLIVCGVLF